MKKITTSCTSDYFAQSSHYAAPAKLREIIKMGLFEKELPSKITDLWNDYHSSKSGIVGGVITSLQYQSLRNKYSFIEITALCVSDFARQISSVCIWAVEWELLRMMMIQLYTNLDDYKKYKSNALPLLILTAFDEFCKTKNIALLRGTIKGGISKEIAESIMRLTIKFYIEKYSYVKTFNINPREFNILEYQELALRVNKANS